MIRWGFGRDYPVKDSVRALEVTGKAFEYLDNDDIKKATMVLLKEKGVRISRASKIIGLADQENLCIYDSRVGYALQTLTFEGKSLRARTFLASRILGKHKSYFGVGKTLRYS